MKKYLPVILWVLLFQLVAGVIGMVTRLDIQNWYMQLAAPPLTPPNALFPVMWTVLYVLIAAAGWRFLHAVDDAARKDLSRLFIAYIVLNWLWSFVFFSAHMLLAGFIWILAVNVVNICLIDRAWTAERKGALMMAPPLIWTSFAAYLNFGYWWFN